MRTDSGRLEVRFAHEPKDTFAPSVPVMGTVAWLLGDLLISKLEAQIDALTDNATAITAEARGKRQADLSDHLLRLEREEEALVCAAIEQGIDVCRRSLANPLAILGLRIGRKQEGKEGAKAAAAA